LNDNNYLYQKQTNYYQDTISFEVLMGTECVHPLEKIMREYDIIFNFI